MNVRALSSCFLGICTIACSWLLWALPAWGQITETAPVLLDGRVVFEVARSGQFSATDRAQEATRSLNGVVRATFRPLQEEPEESISITVSTTETIPTLQLNGRHWLSVTSEDTPEGRSLIEQARIWESSLESAIARAKYERTQQFLIRSALLSFLAVAILLFFLRGINVICDRWIYPYLQESHSTPRATSSYSQPLTTANPRFIAFQIVLNLFRFLLILITLIYISTRFPQTRHLNRQLRDTVIYSLTSDIFPLGNNAYSVLDLIILIALLTALFILARSIKQVLRMRVLSITGLSRAAQETIAVVANYGFILIGTLVLLQLWGLDITSLNVFAGVLGVGVGLGIQGIAKEFVSGLVLIFERPIQVGDFVDVGGLVGTIENISVRSTELTTIDRVSVILPNSRFLEQEVVNWSHRSGISRLHIPVKVAYGSDVELVRQTLLDAANEHSDVLSIPPPNIFFLGFGDSALEFNLLPWISEPRKQFQIKSDLYFLVYKLFQERGITIPFPQQDIHVRSGKLPVELTQERNL